MPLDFPQLYILLLPLLRHLVAVPLALIDWKGFERSTTQARNARNKPPPPGPSTNLHPSQNLIFGVGSINELSAIFSWTGFYIDAPTLPRRTLLLPAIARISPDQHKVLTCPVQPFCTYSHPFPTIPVLVASSSACPSWSPLLAVRHFRSQP